MECVVTVPSVTWPPNNNKTGTTHGLSTIPIRTARKSRRYQQRHYKRQSHKIQREQVITIAAEEKAFYHRSVQVATTITNKIKQQFGFVADPKKTLLHNASSTLATTPTWYYFSRPSHLAFHDFTQQKQPAKKPMLTAWVGIKIHPNTSLHKHMDQTQRNLYAQTPTSYSPTLSFCRNCNLL